jgi:hypothetical protein
MVANATLSTTFSSISSVSATTNLFKTLNLSHKPYESLYTCFSGREGGEE